MEICFGGVWGTICADGWDNRDANVSCTQGGQRDYHYSQTKRTQFVSLFFTLSFFSCNFSIYFTFYFPCNSLAPIAVVIEAVPGDTLWLNNLGCLGNETSLINCSRSYVGIPAAMCNTAGYAGVKCNSTPVNNIGTMNSTMNNTMYQNTTMDRLNKCESHFKNKMHMQILI